jgi:hypothetical protein
MCPVIGGLILRPQRVTKCRYVRRGFEEPRHGPGDAILVTLARIQQRETFERGKLVWPNLNVDQHPPVSPPVAVSFATLPSKLLALIVHRHAHGVTRFPHFDHCSQAIVLLPPRVRV